MFRYIQTVRGWFAGPHFISTVSRAGIGLGPLLWLGAKLWEGYQVSTTVLGLPLWSWEIFGGAIFFFAVAGLLTSYENGMSQEQTLEERFLDEGAETWLRSEADAAFDNLSLTEKWLLRTLIAQGPLTGEDLVSTGQRAGYQDVREAIDRMDRTPSLFISIDRRSFIPRCRIKTLYRKYLKQKLIE